MQASNDVSPWRPLLVGAIVGLVIGLIIGLIWAWLIDPVTYAGGAQPQELSEEFQQHYVGAVAGAYLTNRDVTLAAVRLRTFPVEEKVRLLAIVNTDYTNQVLITEAEGVGNLAQALQAQESWPPEAVSAGLAAGGATTAFANKLGQTPQATQATPPPEAPASEGNRAFRIFLLVLLVVLIVALVVVLLSRIKPRRTTFSAAAAAALAWDGVGPQPLRQWVGDYTLGQDNYDESFTVETAESDFLGECGMGILEGFASGAPKKVLAFDVWLFDKTDIRTVSTPVMSEFAYNDEILRSKLSPEVTPVLAAPGETFEIETTALIIKATIAEVTYGDEPPPNGYFAALKINLVAYLKPDVNVSGSMPVPEGFS